MKRSLIIPAVALLALACGCGGSTSPAPSSWREEPNPDPDYRTLNAVWGTSDDIVFAVGNGGLVLRRSAGAWVGLDPGTRRNLYSVWGTSASNVFVVGARGTILHFDGATWTHEAVDSTLATHDLTGIRGVPADLVYDVYIAGRDGIVLRHAVSSWTRITLPPEYFDSFESVWGTSSDDLYLVGDTGRVLHYDGITWSLSHTASRWLMDVWGSSARDVYAVGFTASNGQGGVLHFDGTSWSEMPLPKLRPLVALWGTGESRIYAVGGTGSIFAFDGRGWSSEYGRHGITLLGVWGRDADDFYAVGTTGVILHYARP